MTAENGEQKKKKKEERKKKERKNTRENNGKRVACGARNSPVPKQPHAKSMTCKKLAIHSPTQCVFRM